MERKGYVPLDELRGHGQHQPSHDWWRKWEGTSYMFTNVACITTMKLPPQPSCSKLRILHENITINILSSTKKNASWWTKMWLYKTRLKEAHECAQSLQIHVPCLLKPQACMWSNQWPTSESSLLERTPTIQNPQ
jgi:hypothetical protein